MCDRQGNYYRRSEGDPDREELFTPVRWTDARPAAEAYWEAGLFANQNSACRLRQQFTLERLADHFGLDG